MLLAPAFCGCLLLAAAYTARAASSSSGTPVETYKVVHTYPHDVDAFTQGLVFKNGALYESTGLQGQSSLRKVDLETGRVLARIDVPRQYFAEGLTDWQNRLIQLTWTTHVGFVYDRLTFAKQTQFTYPGEGWGLTHDDRYLIMSDGSDTLRFLDPQTFSIIRKLQVKDQGEPVGNLNELEYIRGEIWANVWQTDRVALISPLTGTVSAWLDLSGILPPSDRTPDTDVLNGIAYDSKTSRLFVTGKRWPKLFEIKIQKR